MAEQVRGLTLTQPWASLVASGHKRIETRSWRASYRGVLLIHAANGFPPEARAFASEERALGRVPATIPTGAVVAVARLADVRPTEEIAPTISGLERRLGDYSPGRWAWLLDDVRALDTPVWCRGALGLWRADDRELCLMPAWFETYREGGGRDG